MASNLGVFTFKLVTPMKTFAHQIHINKTYTTNATSLPGTIRDNEGRLQFMGAVGRFVHPMSLLQQLEEFLYGDPRVRRAPQGEDLPQQHPVGPPAHTHTHNKYTPARPQLTNIDLHYCLRVPV